MATVTIDRVQRDGLHWNIGMVLDGDDLPDTPTRENRSDVESKIRHMRVCCSILDQIGWEEHGTEESYSIEVGREVASSVARMVASASEYADDERYYVEEARVGRADRSRLPEYEQDHEKASATLAGFLKIVAAANGLGEIAEAA
jgi:hypothetical protein